MSAPAVSVDPLAVYSIGLKLRTLRTAKHLTLTRLAVQTGFSTALLSKLETDRMVPTLQTLEKICRVYGISLGHFFCEPQHHSLAVTRKAHIVERRERPIPRPTPLHVPTADALLISEILELPAGVATTLGECGSKTEVTGYVIEGTLHVSAAGSQEVLQAGDSIVLTTDQAVVLSADANSPCRILTVSARHSSGRGGQQANTALTA